MKKYAVKEYVMTIVPYVLAFAIIIILGYFINGKKITLDNVIFACVLTTLFILMDIYSAFKKKKNGTEEKLNENKTEKADA